MLLWFVDGSDPGLCVTSGVPPAVVEFGRRRKCAFVLQDEAHEVAGETIDAQLFNALLTRQGGEVVGKF